MIRNQSFQSHSLPMFRKCFLSLLLFHHVESLIVASLPEESMSTPQIISYYGYPAEIITATTPDGYILEMHRIPYGRNETFSARSKQRPVVFLQHGLLASSADWVVNLPEQSLGFILADNGFDVWLGNTRGNEYSKRHTKYGPHSEEFWDFSWDEMTLHDVQTQIDRVLKITKQPDLYYVGHSQGTLIMFAKLASDPKFAGKIKKFFALAPVATVAHIQGLIRIVGDHFLTEYKWFIKMTGEHQFLPSTWFSKLVSKMICGTVALMNPLCRNVMFQIGGPEGNQFNRTRLMVYMSHTPSGTSSSNILHWAQMVRSGLTQMYDYGTNEQNLEKYGSRIPPIYNLTQVNAPVYLYYSDSDWLADEKDIESNLLPALSEKYLRQVKKLENYNHFDFIYGLKAPTEIYSDIVKIVNGYEKMMSNKV